MAYMQDERTIRVRTCPRTACSTRRFLSSKGIILMRVMLCNRTVPATTVKIVAKSLPGNTTKLLMRELHFRAVSSLQMQFLTSNGNWDDIPITHTSEQHCCKVKCIDSTHTLNEVKSKATHCDDR